MNVTKEDLELCVVFGAIYVSALIITIHYWYYQIHKKNNFKK
jgi:hypothetical protein